MTDRMEEIEERTSEYIKEKNIEMENLNETDTYCPNLARPIRSVDDKWRLIPAFIQTRGLVRQHVDSFNYFIDEDLKQIVRANSEVRCDADPYFYLKYLDVRVEKPSIEENYTKKTITPQECRLRDLSYTAPIVATIEFTRRCIVSKLSLDTCQSCCKVSIVYYTTIHLISS